MSLYHCLPPMQKKYVKTFLLWFILIGLAACNSRPPVIDVPTRLPTLTPPSKTDLPITSGVQTRWLAGVPCAPPCWEGIIPGQTFVDEALVHLNENPYIQGVEYWSWPDDSEGVVGWHWNDSNRGGRLEYPQAIQDHQDTTNTRVSWITVSFPKAFTLTEIRTAYGDPSHVVPYVGYGGLPDGNTGGSYFYEFAVVYLEQGFFIQTERALYHPPAIGPRMTLSSSVVFFPPTIDGLMSASDWNSTQLIPWQGFQEFGFYCAQVQPESENNRPCPVIKP